MTVSESTGLARAVSTIRPVRSRHPDLGKPGCTQAWVQVEVQLDGQVADLVIAVPIQAVRNGLLGRRVKVTVEVMPDGK